MNNLRIKKKVVIPSLLLTAVLLIYVVSLLNNPVRLSFNVYLTFLLNFIIIVFGILKSKLPLSLNKINWYFILIFLLIIPFYQFTTGYAPRNLYLTEYETIYTNILILIWCLSFYLSYNTTSLKAHQNKNKKNLIIPESKFFYISLLFFSSLSFLTAILLIGFSNFFIRENAGLRGDTFSILFDFLFRSTPVLSLSIYLWAIKKKIKVFPSYIMYLISFFLFVITFILNYPTSLSRFMVGAVYLGVIISALDFSFFKGKRFDVLLIFSIVAVFPLMYLFKFYTIQEILSPQMAIKVNNYNSVDFDAFQMIGRTIRFVEDFGLQYGNQLKNVVFFFVPSAILNIKGIPSGELVATIQNVSFTNLSSPIIAEGFIDFGIIGVIIYASIFGKVAKYFDFRVYSFDKTSNSIYFIEIVFSFLTGFFIYIYRGALQPTFLRLMGFFLFLLIIYILYKIKSTLKL